MTYDSYYQRAHYFGEPYPDLIDFFSALPKRGTLLDLGCGQGRDAIALARLGYAVTGIDNSTVGIDQMNRVAHAEDLDVIGQVGDIYAFDRFDEFDVVLLDSMFHFAKEDKEKEIELIQKIVSEIEEKSLLVVCIQDTEDKVEILNRALDFQGQLHRLAYKKFNYIFEDEESGHGSVTEYRMVVVEKK